MAEGLKVFGEERDERAAVAAAAAAFAASGVGDIAGGEADAGEARAAAARVLLLEFCECGGDGVGGGAALGVVEVGADDAAEASAVRGPVVGVVGEHRSVEGGGFAELAELLVQLCFSALLLFSHTEEAAVLA